MLPILATAGCLQTQLVCFISLDLNCIFCLLFCFVVAALLLFCCCSFVVVVVNHLSLFSVNIWNETQSTRNKNNNESPKLGKKFNYSKSMRHTNQKRRLIYFICFATVWFSTGWQVGNSNRQAS